jgi:hypothetical protein
LRQNEFPGRLLKIALCFGLLPNFFLIDKPQNNLDRFMTFNMEDACNYPVDFERFNFFYRKIFGGRIARNIFNENLEKAKKYLAKVLQLYEFCVLKDSNPFVGAENKDNGNKKNARKR